MVLDTAKIASMTDALEGLLVKYCTEAEVLDSTMLVTEDLVSKWEEMVPEYMNDAVHQFNDYPEFTLACAAYAGMAMANCWDIDWEKYGSLPYGSLQGPNGFDDMDDYIASEFLGMTPGEGEAATLANLMAACASEANKAIRRESFEPGSRDALLAIASVAGLMFRLGASIHLRSLGYSWSKE